MMLNIKVLASYLGSVLCILMVSLSISVTVQADILLKGSMKIGDNDTRRIHPSYLLTAKNSNSNSNLQNPQAFNPINFHLTQDINLTQIQLQNAASINASLYFVIWNSNGRVMVNTRSSNFLYANSQFFNANLPAGDYQIAVIGQCLKLKLGGWKPQGWKNNCSSSIGKKSYDDFYFSDIKLVTPQKSNSITFLQRRHIGDSDERRNDGYGGRWYPDKDEGDDVEYEFSLPRRSNLKSITIYNYRDLIANANNVKLTLSGPNLTTQTIYMNTRDTSGDFVWQLNKTLLPGGKYELEIETDDDGDADDISWDDIVIKFDTDTPPPSNVNHYRIMYPTNALTCESASVTILACTNSSSSGSCDVATDVNYDVDVLVDGNSVAVDLTHGAGTLSGLQHFSEGTLALSFPSGTQTYCNEVIPGQDSCDIMYADIGLQFSQSINSDVDIGNQVAGSEIKPLYLRALKSDGHGTCSVLETDSNDFKLGFECISPMICDINLNFKVGSTSLNDNAETSVSLAKAASGVYKVTQPVYANAGLIRLSASYVFVSPGEGPETLVTDSNSFAVRPYKFNIKAIRKADDNGGIETDLTARDASRLQHTHIASDIFIFEIQSVNKGGAVTTNYIPSANTNLAIKLTRSIPAAGFEGQFSYAPGETLTTANSANVAWTKMTNLPAFDGGIYQFISATYNEVGAIKINVKDENYYGMAFSVDAQLNNDSEGTEIGRFIPDHFTLVSSSIDNYIDNVGNNPSSYDYVYPDNRSAYTPGTTVLAIDGNIYQCRSEWNNSQWCPNPGYEPSVIDHDGNEHWSDGWFLLDSSSGITYMEQRATESPALRFDYRLEARNSLDVLTRNYNAADANATARFVAESGGVDLSNRLVEYGGSWSAGVYQPTVGSDDVIFKRLENSADGPYSLLFGIGMTDDDGVELADMDMAEVNYILTAKRLSNAPSELRFGRWFIYDGSGPIGSAFPVTMELQYYDPNKATGDGFIINIDDSKTPFYGGDVTTTLGSLTDDRGIFKSGSTSELMISSDSPGTAILKYINTPEWLMPADGDEPSARITFDFFYGNDRVIYRRRLN